MKAFLIAVGTVFALLVAVHIWRLVVEPGVAHDPWFIGITLIAAAFSVWAWWLLRQQLR